MIKTEEVENIVKFYSTSICIGEFSGEPVWGVEKYYGTTWEPCPPFLYNALLLHKELETGGDLDSQVVIASGLLNSLTNVVNYLTLRNEDRGN